MLFPDAKQVVVFIRSPTWITTGFAQNKAGPNGANFNCGSPIFIQPSIGLADAVLQFLVEKRKNLKEILSCICGIVKRLRLNSTYVSNL